MKDYGWSFVIWIAVSMALISLFDGMLRENLKQNSRTRVELKCK